MREAFIVHYSPSQSLRLSITDPSSRCTLRERSTKHSVPMSLLYSVLRTLSILGDSTLVALGCCRDRTTGLPGLHWLHPQCALCGCFCPTLVSPAVPRRPYEGHPDYPVGMEYLYLYLCLYLYSVQRTAYSTAYRRLRTGYGDGNPYFCAWGCTTFSFVQDFQASPFHCIGPTAEPDQMHQMHLEGTCRPATKYFPRLD
jgi:hypothetical protein